MGEYDDVFELAAPLTASLVEFLKAEDCDLEAALRRLVERELSSFRGSGNDSSKENEHGKVPTIPKTPKADGLGARNQFRRGSRERDADAGKYRPR